MIQRNWEELDVLFVTGDAYIDHPAFGTALLARLLEAEGFRVGIIDQPDWRSPDAFQIMGRPRLFAAISAGAMDSMVNHYTAAKKKRNNDAYTPGGRAGARPDRAVIAYTSAIKNVFKGLPVIIGGLEASLRRLAHYDYWNNRVRRSILLDSKADLLIYGMAEQALVQLARRMQSGEEIQSINDIAGTAYVSRTTPQESVILPSYDEVASDKRAYNRAFRIGSEQINPSRGQKLAQAHAGRFVVINPPAQPLEQGRLDRLYALPFLKRPHTKHQEPIPAYEQIRFSITSHRGCAGGCAFCAIAHHQGKTVQSRSVQSMIGEVENLSKHPDFRGTITDCGGPSANMYGARCRSQEAQTRCRRPSCLYPEICPQLDVDDTQIVTLLRTIRRHPRVKHLFVASGLRMDLLERQPNYFRNLVRHHVGGLIKVAPESTHPAVTQVMRKPGPASFELFIQRFRQASHQHDKKQAIVPYFMSGHPGCSLNHMIDVALFLKEHQLYVEQVQEFTPTPGSLATCLYYTGLDPWTNAPVYIPRSSHERRLQKALLLWHLPESREDVMAALKLCRRSELAQILFPAKGRLTRQGKKPSHQPRKKTRMRR
jgi:uncharacterized radical SAM protein YgiQ